MYFMNKEITEAQKRVTSFIFKKIGKNLMSGKSLTAISLPIDIFEPRSNLERLAYSFLYAPCLLEEAAN